MLKSTCPKHDVHTLQAEKGSADISWGYSDTYGKSVLPFLLFSIGLTFGASFVHLSRKWVLFVSSASGVSWFYFFQLTHDFPREYFYIYQILLTFAAVLPKTAL